MTISSRTGARLLLALAAAGLISWLLAAAAAADPHFGVLLNRLHAPLHVGDERLAYSVTVRNEAEDKPKIGDQLTCRGTPADGIVWFGSPDPDFTFVWLRNATPIAGATGKTYTTTSTDAGKSIQCVVTGTNDPDGPAGSKYAPIAASVVSLPPVSIEPPPSPLPSGTSRPNISGPGFASRPSGTATTTAGSDLLTEVVTAKGTGTLASGSTVVAGVTMSSGIFEGFQAVAGTCVPEEATIKRVEETEPEVFELTLSKAATCSGSGTLEAGAQPIGPGMVVSGGPCIPPGTEVIAATNNGLSGTVRQIQMDSPATCSETGVPIVATSTLICEEPSGWSAGSAIDWSFRWLRNGEPILGATNPSYTVQSADTEPPSNLQCEATAEDDEGNRVAVLSVPKSTRPELPQPYLTPRTAGIPAVDFENQTAGEVTLAVRLPEGDETHAYKAVGSGWSCTKTPPTPLVDPEITCKRSDVLSPQASYPPLEVVAALGQNPPLTLVTKAEASGGGAPDAGVAEDEYTIPLPRVPFGFEAFKTEVLDAFGADYTQAGGHPFSAGATIVFNTHERAEEDTGSTRAVNGSTRVVRTQTPPGFVGNPRAVAELCPTITGVLPGSTPCPASSKVGSISGETSSGSFASSVYAMEPEEGQPAQFAFAVLEYGFTLRPELRPEDGYAIDLVTQPLSKFPEIFSSEVKLCGFGVVPGTGGSVCNKPGDPGATELPFITNPTRCSGSPPTTRILADSWQEPGKFASAEFTSPALTGCDQVPFEPQISFTPTSKRADAPTGMDVQLTLPTAGLEEPEGIAQANLEGTTVALPEGMTVNPATANGLEACGLDQIGISSGGVPNDNPVTCPRSSKVGSVEVQTPILEDTLKGSAYIARQGSNPFGSLLALYLVIDSPENGILVKLAGKVSPDPKTGRLTVSFDDNPQAPISSVRLRFPGGNHAALINPPACGTYQIVSRLNPWTAEDPDNPSAAETVELKSSFEVQQGPDGGACPTGALEPKLSAGLSGSQAGSTSPFHLRLSREDGTQRFAGLSVTMPPGLTAYLKGVPYCPDPALASVPTAAGTGAAQLASPACPAVSRIGTVVAGVGAGPDPLFVDTGKVYLAGPYKGAPLSLAVLAPAVTGPFDLGNVLVRAALHLNPETAQITAVSDPLPTILEGIPLDVRDVRVDVDRKSFTLAPTNCEPMATSALITGERGATAIASDRFQVGGCEKLGFKPNLKLRLHGSPSRGAYQRLVATVTARPGDANIARASVALPHSIFLAQEHIRTVCTRVQFAADTCPKGSIYGKAKATSPLVDYPLDGLVYLRSSSNPLPDLVVALRGPAHQPLELNLVGRIDSKNGGIRNTFALVPDAPVTKFTLEMRGGKKSLIVNSRNLCKGTQHASVRLGAQNGRQRNFRPTIGNDCRRKGGRKAKR